MSDPRLAETRTLPKTGGVCPACNLFETLHRGGCGTAKAYVESLAERETLRGECEVLRQQNLDLKFALACLLNYVDDDSKEAEEARRVLRLLGEETPGGGFRVIRARPEEGLRGREGAALSRSPAADAGKETP